MKLKTLKDLEECMAGDVVLVSETDGMRGITIKALKQEAIKWINEIRNTKSVSSITLLKGEEIVVIIFADGSGKKVTTKEALSLRILSSYKDGKVDLWIKDFFNITEKKLKKVT